MGVGRGHRPALYRVIPWDGDGEWEPMEPLAEPDRRCEITGCEADLAVIVTMARSSDPTGLMKLCAGHQSPHHRIVVAVR